MVPQSASNLVSRKAATSIKIFYIVEEYFPSQNILKKKKKKRKEINELF